ncbi:MAG: hypothetical protein ACRCYP_03760 [Alphaproteobacteria bacterium]
MSERKIIKEIRLAGSKPNPNNPEESPWKYDAVCVIRSNCYGSSLSTFLEYLAIAQETYPTLRPEDVRVVHFGGQRYKRTFGIEFKPPTGGGFVPDGWGEIGEVELTI